MTLACHGNAIVHVKQVDAVAFACRRLFSIDLVHCRGGLVQELSWGYVNL